MTAAGMPIEGMDETAPRRGPGRPRRDEQQVRPDLSSANEETVRPSAPLNSLQEAERYAQEIFDNYGEIINQDDKFYVPKDSIPLGWVYEWKAVEIVGKPNGYHLIAQKRAGWRPVDADRHPELVPEGFTGPIIKEGLMLMEIPQKVHDFYQMRQKREAYEQVKSADDKLYETPANTAPREEFGPQHGRKISKAMEAPRPQDYRPA